MPSFTPLPPKKYILKKVFFSSSEEFVLFNNGQWLFRGQFADARRAIKGHTVWVDTITPCGGLVVCV